MGFLVQGEVEKAVVPQEYLESQPILDEAEQAFVGERLDHPHVLHHFVGGSFKVLLGRLPGE